MVKRVYIHVGMPKTGTTFLQLQVFPKLKGVDYWQPFNHPMSYYFERFANNNYLCYPEAWKLKIREYLEASEENIHILSYEGFFGSYKNNYKSNYTNSLLLKELFPEAKIILSIRNQIRLIESNYSQIVTEGYVRSIYKYINYHKGRFLNNRNESYVTLNIESLQYDRYIRNYHEQFGASNVLVLPFEMLTRAETQYRQRLATFLGLADISIADSENSLGRKKSLSKNGLLVNRILNRFFICEINNGVGFIPKQPYMFALQRRKNNFLFAVLYFISKSMHPQFIAKKISGDKRKGETHLTLVVVQTLRDFYFTSNQKTSALINEDLASYGY